MEYHACSDEGHQVVRNRPGYLCDARGCRWGTDCSVCMGRHRRDHRAEVECPRCGMSVYLTPTLRWPRHGGDGNPDNRCENSGRKYEPPRK